MAAEVAERERAEQRLGHGVREHVGVGVAVEPRLRRHRDASEHERAAGDERVQVEAEADPRHRGFRRVGRAPRARRRSSGVVIFTLPGSPGTTRTP